ncbi:hypothetical protein HPB50_012056 [Hyalomma asiaticum]|uniref:Uncharacterized protein n=1 Tax=Hyalomma asiaticum TaxID=266040 RepID=A0ACB7T4V0_HYAAI|nr:hypothetical protein HPB50_012056 [Hyalomma asiaticum]
MTQRLQHDDAVEEGRSADVPESMREVIKRFVGISLLINVPLSRSCRRGISEGKALAERAAAAVSSRITISNISCFDAPFCFGFCLGPLALFAFSPLLLLPPPRALLCSKSWGGKDMGLDRGSSKATP